MRKHSKLAIVTLAIAVLLGTNVFAATDYFDDTLPAKQGDTEVSTVGRANDRDVYKYFTIKITSLGSGYTSVRAWTEDSWGANLSDPYNEVDLNNSENINYSVIPYKGDNVKLNLDNPVYSTSTVSVSGNWTPN